MESQDDPIVELRLYRIEPGRMDDMQQLWQEDLAELFPRHGINPLGGWRAIAGASAPLFVYLMPWRHLQHRGQSFSTFGTDPQWAQAAARIDAQSPLVQRYDVLFLRAMRDWQAPAAAAQDGAVFELILQETAQGHAAEVRRAVFDVVMSAWAEAGAQVCGAFDVMSGYSQPSAAFVLAWPDLATRTQAFEALQTRLGGLRAANGRTPLLQRADQTLMQSVPVDWK